VGGGFTPCIWLITFSVCNGCAVSCRLSEVMLKNKKGNTVELSPTMPANTAESVAELLSLSLIQRYNAVAVLGTFTHTTPEDEMSVPAFVLVFRLVFSLRDLYYRGQ